MPYLHLIDEAIGLIDNEIRIVEWRIKYPEQFKRQLDKPPLSPLYLADKATLINIMEIVSGLFISKNIVYQNGKPAYRAKSRSFLMDWQTLSERNMIKKDIDNQ